MIAKNLINETIPPLKLSDTGSKALDWMAQFHVQHLPVVDGTGYVGMISENDILDKNMPDLSFESYELYNFRPYVEEQMHIYEVVKEINDNSLSSIPVLDEEEVYKGIITSENLLEFFAKVKAVQEPGGIIILEMHVSDYTLSQIAQIIESNDAKVLSMYVTTHHHSPKMEVTLKINRTDLSRIIATFERYEYKIAGAYQENVYIEDMQERFDAFMNYLNI